MLKEQAPFFKITPLFETNKYASTVKFHREATYDILHKIIPPSIKTLYLQDKEECFKQYRELLPIVTVAEVEKAPCSPTFTLLCQVRPGVFQFFFELISRWLVPGKRLNVELFFATDFRLSEFSEEVFTLIEAMVRVDTQADLEVLQKHLPIIDTELRLGAASVYHARRIMEIKGLGTDEKTAKIHETIASLLKKDVRGVDLDIFSEMQHFLINCSDRFKAIHEYQYMSRVICFLYFFRKWVKQAHQRDPENRHIIIKFMRTRLHQHVGVKRALGALVALSLDNHEIFEETHLIKGIQNIVPQAKVVENSFFTSHSLNNSTRTLYLEVEKRDGTEFSSKEIEKLSKELPSDLKNAVERLLHPIFMPQNEEEIMRNIVTLSKQLKYVGDIPEVILSFYEQTGTHLSFMVTLVRILKKDLPPIQECFLKKETFLEYIPERIKNVGLLRKKYTKEATVFYVRLPKAKFLREDHSVDLYRARHAVVEELVYLIGELRDFNGGMISKQNELFLVLKELLGGVGNYHELLLENFFYSLTPLVMRSLLEPSSLKKLFLLLLDAIDDSSGAEFRHLLRYQQEPGALFMVAIVKEKEIQENLIRAVNHLKSMGFESAYVNLHVQDKYALGFIYQSEEQEKRALFYSTVEEVIKSW